MTTAIPLNEHTRFILGQPCFAIIDLARLLRASGHEIKRRAEDEQAAVAHFLLNIYLEHGEAWRDAAGDIIGALVKVQQTALDMAEGGL